MEYIIDTSKPFKINWNAKGSARILQNVANLLNTFRYEIAYARTIGINPDWFNKPAKQAASIITNSIMNLLSMREPRVKVKRVKYLGITEDGNISMKVVIEI